MSALRDQFGRSIEYLRISVGADQSFTVPHTPDHVEGWFQEISSYLQESPLIIGQEYSHFSQLTNPPSTGRHVRSFIPLRGFPFLVRS